MPKIILGFVGEMASGKGTVVSYIQEKYGAATYSFSTMLRDMLDRLYLPHTRDNMIDLSVWVRGHFGEDVMARTMANDIEKDPHDIVAVEGIRRPADIEYLKKLPGFHVIEIIADERARFERLVKRAQNPGDATKTLEEFQADSQKPTEISIREVAREATERVDNNGTVEELQQQLDALIKKYAS
ncbi:MAG: AAA family ATPase [Patescibacteria group bacterium]